MVSVFSKNRVYWLICYILVSTLFEQVTLAEEMSETKRMVLESFKSFCKFNPQDDLTYMKVLSSEEDLINKTSGHTIDMFCKDGVLRKIKSDAWTEVEVKCKPFIETDDGAKQILHFYWDISVLKDVCGREPVCSLMKNTYDHPMLTNTSQELLHEEELSFEGDDNRTINTAIAFYPIGTHQMYNISDDACDDNSFFVDGDNTYSTCDAPSSLAVIPDDDDSELMTTSYFHSNYGVWSLKPPECELKRCEAPDLVALGFTDNDVLGRNKSYYIVGDTVDVACADGESQQNSNIDFETITCRAEDDGTTGWARPPEAGRITQCSVRQCVAPTGQDFNLGNTVTFTGDKQTYEFGDTVEMSCADGFAQLNQIVMSETLTCRGVVGQPDHFIFHRETNGFAQLNPCETVECEEPVGLTFEILRRGFGTAVDTRDGGEEMPGGDGGMPPGGGEIPPGGGDLDGSSDEGGAGNVYTVGAQLQVTCDNINFTFITECFVEGRVGLWLPAPHCEPKTCQNFMADPLLYEHELRFGRNVVGEPKTLEFNESMSFVCPKGTVAFGRNELAYVCRLNRDGFGWFEAVEPDVFPDCREITCPKTDPITGLELDITYPYYERKCEEQGECKKGMILSLDCTDVELNFKPFFQCDIPEDAPKLATTEQELKEAVLSGKWFPTPTCERGCSPPGNFTGISCEIGRQFDKGQWTFVDGYIVSCVCVKGFTRDDDTPPQVTCDAGSDRWEVTRSCHVDCNPTPDLPHARMNITYFDTYALMQIVCKDGYQFFPTRHPDLGPAVIECHLGSNRWLNSHLWQCKAVDGCTLQAVQEMYPDVYLSPAKQYYNDGEVALARCSQGYLQGDVLYHVLVCKANYVERPLNVDWSLIKTDAGPPPDNLDGFRVLPNVTMEFTGFQWNYQNVKGTIKCITDYEDHYPQWEIVKDLE